MGTLFLLIQASVMAGLAVLLWAGLYPHVFWLALARIVARLRARWRRYLVQKYGRRATDQLYLQARRQLTKAGWTSKRQAAAYRRLRPQLIEELGQHIVDSQWGPPTWLDQLLGH